MKGKDFDREKNPAAQVGIWYNEEDNRYYIVMSYHDSEEFTVIEPYIRGILHYPSSNGRLSAAVNHARQYADCHFAYVFVGFVPADMVMEASSVAHCATPGEEILIAKRKYNGEEYTFVSRGIGKNESRIKKAYAKVWCCTPIGIWGYPNILRVMDDGSVLEEEVGHTPAYIKRRVRKVLKELEEVGDYYSHN